MTNHAEDYFDHVAALHRQGLNQDGSPRTVTDTKPYPISQPDPNRPRPPVGTRGQLGGRIIVMTTDGWRFEGK